MELANLPTELLMQIAKELDSDSDINTLCRTSRGFHSLLVDFLYRHNATSSHVKTSAILWAARHGQVSTAEMALEAGVDVNSSQDALGTLPLVEATRLGNARLVRLFLARGACPNVLHGKAGTILHTAAARWDMDTATALLHHGANVHAQRFDNGETPLHTAINSGAIMTGGPTEMIKLLLDHGADVAGTDFVGSTPLHCAAACGNIAAIHILLDNGADALLSVRGAHMETPLHSAIRARNEAAAKVLMQKGADVDATDNLGVTVFSHAVKFGCADILTMLLDRGADVNTPDPVHEVPLVAAAFHGHLPIVRVLLRYGVDVKADSALGEKAVYMAISRGHATVVQALLDAGVDVRVGDESRWPLLQRAVIAGHDDVVRVLLRNGADVNGRDGQSGTPLHWASQKGCTTQVGMLLAHGADTTVKNDIGCRPVDLAEKKGEQFAQVREMLLGHVNGK